MREYRPWVEGGISEAEYWKRAYLLVKKRSFWQCKTIVELVREQGNPICRRIEDLATNCLWDTDAEFEAFIENLRKARGHD